MREVRTILCGERLPRPETLAKLARAVPRLEATKRERADHQWAVLAAVRRAGCRERSIRQFAVVAGVHYPHLTEVLAGRRRPNQVMLAKEAGMTEVT